MLATGKDVTVHICRHKYQLWFSTFFEKIKQNSTYHWHYFKTIVPLQMFFSSKGPMMETSQPSLSLSISVPNLQLSAAQYLNDVWGWAKPTPQTRDNLHRGKIWENKHAATKHYQIPVEFIGCSLKVNIWLLGGGCQCLCRLSAGLFSAQAQWHFSSGVFEQPSAECSPTITPPTILFLSLINATCFSLNQN